jgi:hypothetical protein
LISGLQQTVGNNLNILINLIVDEILQTLDKFLEQHHEVRQNKQQQELSLLSDSETTKLIENDVTAPKKELMSSAVDNNSNNAFENKVIAATTVLTTITTSPIQFKPRTYRVIEKQKLKISKMFVKQGECIIAIGKALEKEQLIDKSEICTTITHILQAEIKKGIISRKTIERHCLSEWKKKTRPIGSITATSTVAKTEIDKLSISSGTTSQTAAITKDQQQSAAITTAATAVPIEGSSSSNATILDIASTASLDKINGDTTQSEQKATTICSSGSDGGDNCSPPVTEYHNSMGKLMDGGWLIPLNRSQFFPSKQGMDMCFEQILFQVTKDKYGDYELKFRMVDMDMSGVDPTEYLSDEYLSKDDAVNETSNS